MNPLPPQAYTKETLLKAYSWVMNQSASIKDMASTPDILVSLYLKATRDGESALDRPSIQNFKNELKSLAGMMGELDRAPADPILSMPASSTMPGIQAAIPETRVEAKPETRTETRSEIRNEARNEVRHEARPENRSEARTEARVESKNDLKSQLDPLSLSMIHEVKLALNLSSDVEALRMLIKIGYTRSQNLLK